MSEHESLWQKISEWWHLLWHHAHAGTLPDAPVPGGAPVTIPPIGGTVTPPAPPPPDHAAIAGIIGDPNSDRLVQIQAVEDARAKYQHALATETEPNNAYWAQHLPHWWAVDEVAGAFAASDAAALYVHGQCNKSMLTGALLANGFNDMAWHVWVDRPGSAERYPDPLDVAVVAGPNPLPNGQGFAGIKIADMPALLEKNRAWMNSRGPVDPNAPWVAGPGH